MGWHLENPISIFLSINFKSSPMPIFLQAFTIYNTKSNIMKSSKLLYVLLLLTYSNIFGQIECPSCDKYLNVIYNYLHIVKRTNLKQDFKEWFFSQKFEDEYKNNNTNLSVTIPIYGVPVTFGGSNESSDAWTKRDSVSRITSFQIDYSTYESIFSKSATGDSRQKWLDCVKLCYQNSGLNPVKISVVSSNDQSITVNYSYVYSTGASIPVIINFTGNGVDLSSTRSYQGQIMNTNGTAITLPWNNRGETSASISMNTTRGTASTDIIEKPLPAVQIQYSYSSYEDQMVGTRSVFIINPGCSNCGCSGRPCYGGNGATVVPAHLEADPNSYYKNARYTRDHLNSWVKVFDPEYWLGIPPFGTKGSSDSAKIVTIRTDGWGPGFDLNLIVDVYSKKEIRNQSIKELPVINKKVLFDIPASSSESETYLIYKGQKYQFATLKDQPFIRNINKTENSVEKDYQIEFN